MNAIHNSPGGNSTSPAVAALRSELWDAGYRPVAVYGHDVARLAEKDRGKRPKGNGWELRARQDPPEAAEAEPDADALNTGILCDGLRPIDLDVEDGPAVAKLRALAFATLGEAPTRTRHNSSRCLLLYAAAEGEPAKRVLAGGLGKIEVLGRGQQFVAFGRHPTGAPLLWHPEAPTATTTDTLPRVTEAQITAFLAAAAEMIGAEQKAARDTALGGAFPHTPSMHGPSADPLDVATALACIPNSGAPDWEWWNRVGMATWAATGGRLAGFAAWAAWSERHLAHDPEACRERWEHFPTSPPNGIGAGTLFHLARQARPDWRKPTDADTTARADSDADPETQAEPDLSVLRLHRRSPPSLPMEILGARWAAWVQDAAKAGACPPDYVVAPLLASVSALIGNSRWAQAHPGWSEPPNLWTAAVGDSGSSKSPGADPLLRHVLPALERRLAADFPDKLREHQAAAETAKAKRETWEREVRTAAKSGTPPPMPPADADAQIEPQMPRLRQNDVTIEKVATLLASASPKGLLMLRDELSGWLLGMSAYSDAARPFWLEAYGGRPYRVERVKHPVPIEVPHLIVSWFGGTQPEKLAEMMRDADDGLLARFAWFWPDPVPFNFAAVTPNTDWATEAMDRLRLLEMAPGADPRAPLRPVFVPMVPAAQEHLVEFARQMQAAQADAGGLMRSALGKARGLVLRLSLVFELLWWCGSDGMAPPPGVISERATLAALQMVDDYLIPMARRVYGDAAATVTDRDAATLARWIAKERPTEVHVRKLQREVRLPGLKDATAIHAAAKALLEAGWLSAPASTKGSQVRPRAAYPINPRLLAALPE